MKTLHVPFHFYPESVGGTEVYALALAQRLIKAGAEAEIAAPGTRRDRYCHDGVQVHRFGFSPEVDISVLYGAGDPVAAEQFDDILQETMPDVVHLHAMSPAISLSLLRKIKRRGLRVVFTVHIPGIICSRGTLLEHGTNVCDGRANVSRCSQCALEAKGIPQILAIAGAALPILVGQKLAATGLHGRWATALRMTELQSLRSATLHHFLNETDSIVAVSEWLRKVLINNGVQEKKILLCRHGATQTEVENDVPRRANAGRVVRIVYIGRMGRDKGVHILVNALLSRPKLAIELDVYGIVQDELAESYAKKLREASDNRITYLDPIPNRDVPRRLREYDALAVPSLVTETGPLTVYDAFSAGIPVIGSRRAGIAELVTHDQDGILVAPGDVGAWAEALESFSRDSHLRARLRQGVKPPRSMDAVASDMIELYQRLLAVPHIASSDQLLETHAGSPQS